MALLNIICSKKYILVFFACALTGVKGYAQKRRLDFNTSSAWPLIENGAISGDGRFAEYVINVPNQGETLTLQATDHSWKKTLTHVAQGGPYSGDPFFSDDSKRFIFKNKGDSVGICELGTDHILYIANVSAFRITGEGGKTYLAYQLKDSLKTLAILDLSTGAETHYPGVQQYLFDARGRSLVMVSKSGKGIINDITWLDLATGNIRPVMHVVPDIGQLVFDQNGKKLAIMATRRTDGKEARSLYYYQQGMDSAKKIAGPDIPGLDGLSVSDGGLFFSSNGRQLFFNLAYKHDVREKSRDFTVGANVSIRGIRYPDDFRREAANGPFMATVNLDDSLSKVIRLQQDEDKGRGNAGIAANGDWIVMRTNTEGNVQDYKWSVKARPDIYLVSTKDGTKTLIKNRLMGDNEHLAFSPSGKYLVWFDREQGRWNSYHIARHKTTMIKTGSNVPVFFDDELPDLPSPYPIAGWLENDKGLLIYDRYDIWEADPDGIRAPINLTHGWGAAHKIVFRCLTFDHPMPVVSPRDTLILSAFDLTTKQDGFYRLIKNSGKLEMLSMSAHVYTHVGASPIEGAVSPMKALKAIYANIYVVSRMSATEYPNLYITHDLKKYEPLTDLAPQKQFNWYTTELKHWRLPNGKTAEGLLFKPEDFDPKKKYPIIFYYYEKLADDLNLFINPSLSMGPMNIAWFVSNGYLVFVPDIYYQRGCPSGRSACNSVVSAAKYLSQFPCADANHMGLQGQSYGGEETNYIVSHSRLFAAAAPSSGYCDEIVAYNEIEGMAPFYENRQGRYGATLWERPDLYIENSAVFKADQVITPVLIMHTSLDPFGPQQGLEWYDALRRLGKKVWLLQYDGESHALYNEKNQLDYSIRLGQFFDHYLKGAPPPKWMTGVTYPSKGDYGYDLDTSSAKR